MLHTHTHIHLCMFVDTLFCFVKFDPPDNKQSIVYTRCAPKFYSFSIFWKINSRLTKEIPVPIFLGMQGLITPLSFDSFDRHLSMVMRIGLNISGC